MYTGIQKFAKITYTFIRHKRRQLSIAARKINNTHRQKELITSRYPDPVSKLRKNLLEIASNIRLHDYQSRTSYLTQRFNFLRLYGYNYVRLRRLDFPRSSRRPHRPNFRRRHSLRDCSGHLRRPQRRRLTPGLPRRPRRLRPPSPALVPVS